MTSRLRLVLAIIRFFDRQPKPLVILLALASLVPLGLLDYVVGYDAVFGFFYLVPVSFATWHAGLRWGVFFAVLGAAIWAFATASAGATHSQPWGPFTRLMVFLFVTLLVSALRTAHDQEAALARTDALTGTANTRWFHEQLDREIRRCKRYRHPFTVIYGDLDNFKTINDRLGHTIGDTLLQEVAEAMQRGVRNTDIVARLGGDEFAVLLPETGETAGNLVAQQLRQGVLEAMERRAWPVRGSFGVVTCVDPPASAEALLKLADELMYAAKREGKGGVRHAIVVASPAPHHVSPGSISELEGRSS
jgi:diguanylate cyclase (GGDEF)-like protein